MRRSTRRKTPGRSAIACALCAACGATLTPRHATAAVRLHTNQVAYDARGPKLALIESDAPFTGAETASLVDDMTSIDVAPAALSTVGTNDEWAPGEYFYAADFSAFRTSGTFHARVTIGGIEVASAPFQIEDDALANLTIPSILSYYKAQRAVSPEEWAADEAVLLNDGSKRVNMRGGWCDASGDVSKYFSHLAYANFMNPQQTPMVTWELTDAAERIPGVLNAAGVQGAMQDEALWGADYLYRALSTDDYFYMVVFSFFSSNATDRKVVGLLANSVTNKKWRATFRAGGGLAIAALARISRWNKNGTYFTAQNYLDGAKRAFANLLVNNTSYVDDGKENIIDDYGALMAASELWIATLDTQYRDEARKRMNNLAARMTPAGYFRADDATRPFWHAADAGLPVVALVRYLDEESDASFRATALDTIKKALDYEIAVTNEVGNPYGYARQSFVYQGAVKDGFFIPQDNETGWWWQGENARLASLAAAAILGGRLVYPADNSWGVDERLASFASRQLAWILGANPYDVCFMNGFGQTNPPTVTANFGHGTQNGGIANGITGQEGKGDGTGIDYKTSDNGNEWRWIEQWIPHAGWFLTAVAAMAQRPSTSGTGMGMGMSGADTGVVGTSGGQAGARPDSVSESSGCTAAPAGAGRSRSWAWAIAALVIARVAARRRLRADDGSRRHRAPKRQRLPTRRPRAVS